MAHSLQCGRYRFLWGGKARPLVMGILNSTPDSFFDGSHSHNVHSLLGRAEKMISAGVDIIDIGGESTRPGASSVTAKVELARVMPIVRALLDSGVAISVDTYKYEVMAEVLSAGVDMINDVRGLRTAGALALVSQANCGVCLMHMQHTPDVMQTHPHYENVVEAVHDFFSERLEACQAHHILQNRLILDVGLGFGKTVAHNVALLHEQRRFSEDFSLPMLVGLSRKSMLGEWVNKPVEERLVASVAGALAAVAKGAHIVRVHDVAETIDALKIWQAVY